MDLAERQKSVLGAVIKEHIRTAKPVSSEEILEKFGFKASPATIRHEMSVLAKSGYLEQPHTSSGRVPTDRGYRFFVDNLIEETPLSGKEKDFIERVLNIGGLEECACDLGRIMADFSKTFTLAGFLEKKRVFKSGLSKVFAEPEFFEQENVKDFGKLIDILDEEMNDFFEDFDEEKVLIGEENPIKEGGKFSLLMSSWKYPRGQNGFMIMVGPKRTNYSKNLTLLRYLNDLNS